jgi:RPA family protein
MSTSERPGRQVAHRAFSSEFNQATYTFRESEDKQAPIFALLPTGAAANRVFVVGTLTETENVGTDEEYWRGRVVDPVGTFFVYAGVYQPGAMEVLKAADTPLYVAVVGKPRTYETDDGGVNVSLRAESITTVPETTRSRWIVEAADRTVDRIARFDDPDNRFAAMAREQYDMSIDRFQDMTIRALESLLED